MFKMKKKIKKLKSGGSSHIAAPKRGELPYYILQITYSDWVFSLRISSIWWFKYFKCLHAQQPCKKNSQILHAQQFFLLLFAVHLYHHTAWILVTVLNIPVEKLNEI